MKQRLKRAFLIYGTPPPEKTNLPLIDITRPEWEEELDIEEGKFFCFLSTSVFIKKKLPIEALEIVTSVPSIEEALEEKSENNIAAAKSDNILISRKYHPSVSKTKAWLSSYHLQLVNELLSKGFKIELLDEQGNIIRNLGEI